MTPLTAVLVTLGAASIIWFKSWRLWERIYKLRVSGERSGSTRAAHTWRTVCWFVFCAIFGLFIGILIRTLLYTPASILLQELTGR